MVNKYSLLLNFVSVWKKREFCFAGTKVKLGSSLTIQHKKGPHLAMKYKAVFCISLYYIFFLQMT